MQWLHREKEALEQANLEKLRREGFPEPVIARLYDLRRDYGQDEQDQRLCCKEKADLVE